MTGRPGRYDLREDPLEQRNVAAEHPEKFAEMQAEWQAYARSVGYIEASGDRALAHMSAKEFFPPLRQVRLSLVPADGGITR